MFILSYQSVAFKTDEGRMEMVFRKQFFKKVRSVGSTIFLYKWFSISFLAGLDKLYQICKVMRAKILLEWRWSFPLVGIYERLLDLLRGLLDLELDWKRKPILTIRTIFHFSAKKYPLSSFITSLATWTWISFRFQCLPISPEKSRFSSLPVLSRPSCQ